MKRFALTGAAGYIAPRHMEAIKQNDGQLVAALDPNDSVGHMDSYFPNSLFFNNFERFERYINRIISQSKNLDYLSICSPNYLHDTHCRFALNNGMDAICEKPLVLNPWNLDILQRAEEQTGKRIYNILQLRLHPEIIKLKEWVDNQESIKVFDIDLTYITSRGPWYHISWKGDVEKSGGIASNIGVHFFDMLMWIFGDVQSNKVFEKTSNYSAGLLELKKANVKWFLSVDAKHLKMLNIENTRTHRSLKIDGKEIDFSKGFEELHNFSYEKIIKGQGFGTSDVRNSIELIHNIRIKDKANTKGTDHPILSKIM